LVGGGRSKKRMNRNKPKVETGITETEHRAKQGRRGSQKTAKKSSVVRKKKTVTPDSGGYGETQTEETDR